MGGVGVCVLGLAGWVGELEGGWVGWAGGLAGWVGSFCGVVWLVGWMGGWVGAWVVWVPNCCAWHELKSTLTRIHDTHPKFGTLALVSVRPIFTKTSRLCDSGDEYSATNSALQVFAGIPMARRARHLRTQREHIADTSLTHRGHLRT